MSDVSFLSWLNLGLSLLLLLVVVLGTVLIAGPYLRAQTGEMSQELGRRFAAAWRTGIAPVEERLAALEAQTKELAAAVKANSDRKTGFAGDETPAPSPGTPTGQGTLLEAQIGTLSKELVELKGLTAVLRAGVSDSADPSKEGGDALKRLMWPAGFLEGGSLAPWRDRIVERIGQSDLDAFEVYLALGRFNLAARQAPSDFARLAQTLHDLSLAAHRFWKATESDLVETSQEWILAFQSILDGLRAPLAVKPVFAGDRFDLNTMLCSETSLGKRFSVKEPLSWVLWDKSGTDPRVLHPGHVITC